MSAGSGTGFAGSSYTKYVSRASFFDYKSILTIFFFRDRIILLFHMVSFFLHSHQFEQDTDLRRRCKLVDSDFHSCRQPINDYNNENQVWNCEVSLFLSLYIIIY